MAKEEERHLEKKKKVKQQQQQQKKNPEEQGKQNRSEEKLKFDNKEENGEERKEEHKVNNNANSSTDKKRKRKEVFPYGNYKNYYGYRIGGDMDEDPRLKVLKSEWFEGKDCFDIGCNNGSITIHIAKKFHCQSILGIDIDSDRISDAYWHLRKIERGEKANRTNGKAPELKVTEKVNDSAFSIDRKEAATEDLSPKGRALSDIVSFQRENFVQSRLPLEKHYDTILCLSVTKWVHLNWGDDGLFTLFSKIWTLLRPGGILVLEPQPWKSYESNRLVSETTAMNYKTIKWRPEHFQDILLDKIGFRSVEDLTSDLSCSKSGFKRPIFAFHK